MSSAAEIDRAMKQEVLDMLQNLVAHRRTEADTIERITLMLVELRWGPAREKQDVKRC